MDSDDDITGHVIDDALCDDDVLDYIVNDDFVAFTEKVIESDAVYIFDDLHRFLKYACSMNSVNILKVLLRHPGVNVNYANCDDDEDDEDTGLIRACMSLNTTTDVIKLLLSEERTDASVSNFSGRTAFWYACWQKPGVHTMKLFIASGKDLGKIKDFSGHLHTSHDSVFLSSGHGNPRHSEVLSLLREYISSPDTVRYRIRTELKMHKEIAADVYAHVVFLCDGLLEVKKRQTVEMLAMSFADFLCDKLLEVKRPVEVPALSFVDEEMFSEYNRNDGAVRFFCIARKLPLELQMLLCNRVVDSSRQSVLRKHSEPAFKHLARLFWVEKEEK